jgi:hypothetical protein
VSRSGRTRHRSGLHVSAKARAKLAAALRHYRPRRFEGAVTALVSRPYSRYFVDANNAEGLIWLHLLPQLRVQVVGETHRDVQGASSSQPAMIMQSIFDAAASALRKRSDKEDGVTGLPRAGERR